MASSRKLYALTIFGYRKPGMDESEYHDYISKTHAGHLKALMVKNDIVSFTMQHNTTPLNASLSERIMGPHLSISNIHDCDAIIQIVFNNVEDYIRVQEDPHYKTVVAPDHERFADLKRTKVAMGWFEVHVEGGKVVG